MESGVRKAVFPVAGLGTRFLPATKANPKEMLPIVDKPLIQHAVEEAVSAGITQLIFVTSSSKRAIEDHFDGSYELENRLRESQKLQLLEVVKSIRPAGVNCIYVRQPEPKGLGNAVLCAREVVGNEPFAVLLADDLMDNPGGNNCLAQMVDVYQKYHSSVIAVEPIDLQDSEKYGIVDIEQGAQRIKPMRSIIEKPTAEQAPSNLAVAGRYILRPEIFDCLKTTQIGRGGEVQLTDAIRSLMDSQMCYSYEFLGKRYDCGAKLGYMQACVEFAGRHHEIGAEFNKYLQGFADDSNNKQGSAETAREAELA